MADITPIRTAAESALIDLFPVVRASLPGDARMALAREVAFGRFAAAGLPHRRVEAWKYTDLRALLREAAPPAAAPDAAAVAAAAATPGVLAGVEAVRLTLVDGHLVAGLSDLSRLPAGVEATSLAAALGTGHSLVGRLGQALATDDPIVALNAALMTDGVVLRVSKGTAVPVPVALRFVRLGDTPRAAFSRVLVVVEEGASLTLFESHEGPDGVGHQANTVVEILVGAGATVEHVRIATRGTGAVDLSTLGVHLSAGTRFATTAMVTTPALSRHQVFATFAGEGVRASIAGGAMVTGRQHADTTLLIDHAEPGGESRELFKHVLDVEATGVFQGKIIVRPVAQKTDGRMMSQAVLLSEGASMYNKPELEIFADDVQCGHGATCGALDEDLLFYLRARGLPKPEAEALMLQAFVGGALETIAHEGVRAVLEDVTAAWLAARR